MSQTINKCSARETAACCCVDTGIVIDNSDCSARWSALFPDRAAAEAMLLTLTEKAQQTASEPCEITSQFTSEPEGIRLNAEFTFACQAEALIYQLALR